MVRAMKYYLAGGAVRSLLLGEKPHDFDYAFSGSAEDFLALNPSARKLGDGPAYQLGHCEYTAVGEGLRQNILNRDFTINAFLLEENGVLHMHPDALKNLRENILAPCTAQSLADDPLRIFRAARFCAVYPQFRPSLDCLKLMADTAKNENFGIIAPERVGQECVKALNAPQPGNFLRVLEQGCALNYWFDELSGAGQIPAGPPQYHNSDVLEHIARTMDKVVHELRAWLLTRPGIIGKRADELAVVTAWMSLCHDLGKVSTPSDILPHHYLHEVRGMQAALDLADRLRLPAKLRNAGLLAAKLHMKAGVYYRLRPSTRVDLLMEAHARELVVPLFLLAQADSGTAGLVELAERELEQILSVRLPVKWENRGKESGRHLREMRCNAISRVAG